MSKVNLIAQVCMYNEVKKGNLDRCLDNLIRYCDRVIVYDDASTDNSVEIAERYGCHVIKGQVNNQMQELAHKQAMLEVALAMGATHLFWLDCDEVLDRPGTMGGIRQLCEDWPDGLDAYSFPEINLWRSQTWQRMDSLFTKARFVRLWRAVFGISFNVIEGVHKQLYPVTIKNIQEASFGIIHYGFHDYKKMLEKIGANAFNWKELHNNALTNWILDERQCSCLRLPDEVFPPGCLPPDIWEQPQPRPIESLLIYEEIPDSPVYPLADRRSLEEWGRLHQDSYHGDYEAIKKRNCQALDYPYDSVNRASLFKFAPLDKVIIDLACGGGWFMLDCLKNGAHRVYGLEINQNLIDQAEQSWRELGVDTFDHKFLYIGGSLDISWVDLVYSVAMFMHLPFWQAVRYFQWIHEVLKPAGEAHLQFYQAPGSNMTMFWDGTTEGKGDSVSTIRMENELERAGFMIKSKRLAEGEGILPVWQMYHCVKRVV